MKRPARPPVKQPEDARAGQVLGQQEGQAGTQQALEDGRHASEQDRVAQRGEEDRRLEQADEVVEADKVAEAAGADVGVADAEVEGQHERVADHGDRVEDGARHQQQAERALAFESTGQRRRPSPLSDGANAQRLFGTHGHADSSERSDPCTTSAWQSPRGPVGGGVALVRSLWRDRAAQEAAFAPRCSRCCGCSARAPRQPRPRPRHPSPRRHPPARRRQRPSRHARRTPRGRPRSRRRRPRAGRRRRSRPSRPPPRPPIRSTHASASPRVFATRR